MRVGTLIFGKPALRDRDEEEMRGYRDALKLIHESGAKLPINEGTIKRLHKLRRGDIWDAGAYKEKDVDIIQTYPDGHSRVRFKTVPASNTSAAMAELVELWKRGMNEKWLPPLALAAALNLDFLCIHPFRDGNGRVSRLLFLLACYHCGIEAGRYISLERLIEQNKERYYEVLEHSSQRWHEGKHDPWPAMNFLLFILTQACKEFEERVGRLKSPRGHWPPDQDIPRRRPAERMSRCWPGSNPPDSGSFAKREEGQSSWHRPERKMGKARKLGINS
jgi:Fic family protein